MERRKGGGEGVIEGEREGRRESRGREEREKQGERKRGREGERAGWSLDSPGMSRFPRVPGNTQCLKMPIFPDLHITVPTIQQSRKYQPLQSYLSLTP